LKCSDVDVILAARVPFFLIRFILIIDIFHVIFASSFYPGLTRFRLH
jgi:hypothetical protein